jgi:hypothetical protein
MNTGGPLVVRFDDGCESTSQFDDPREVGYSGERTANLDLAFVVLIHKAQGSEFACTVVAPDESHSPMLTAALLFYSWDTQSTEDYSDRPARDRGAVSGKAGHHSDHWPDATPPTGASSGG